MTILCLFFALTALLAVLSSTAIARRTKKQISEMLEALSDIKSGNGNRRILAKENDLTAPLAYEINGIVLTYENRLRALRQTQKANRQLMASLSHDVRTPLTTLIGYLDAARKGVVTGTERDDYIETACRKAHALKDSLDMLFDWFRLNANEFVLKTGTVEMAELTRNILIDWIPLFEEMQMEYDVSIPEQPFLASLDPDGYRRILNNLIQNAVTHSQADKLTISLQKFEDRIHIQLSDNGKGIKPEDLEHIFERLYKGHGDSSEKSSGLGLSIAYQLAEKMCGQITAESQPGKGTVFTLTFPFALQ